MEIKINKYGMKGLFSTRHYAPGEIIACINGTVLPYPTRMSFQTGPREHIETHNVLQYENHSCNPNTMISGRNIICIKPVQPGDELTFDYNHSEDELAHPFICTCCGRWIRGKKYVQTHQPEKIDIE